MREKSNNSGRPPQRKNQPPKKKWYPKKREQKILDQQEKDSQGMRLNKYLSNAGVCTRREADLLIPSGIVEVNGKTITELGIKILPTDEVKFDGRLLSREKPVYILMNKPKGFITNVKGKQKRKTVLELLRKNYKEGIIPVEKLDKDTTGVLILTNDVQLAQVLGSPKSNIKRIYHIHLEKPMKKDDIEKLSTGITLEDGVFKADKVSYVGNGLNKKEIGIEIKTNKYKLIHRMLEKIGYSIAKLDLVSYAGFTKQKVPRSEHRMLTKEEVTYLKRIK